MLAWINLVCVKVIFVDYYIYADIKYVPTIEQRLEESNPSPGGFLPIQ